MRMVVEDWGRVAYQEAWDRQVGLSEQVKAGGPDTLVLVEHDPVLTLGANFHEENLLRTLDEYRDLGIGVIRTDRGGDVTYHGPNQLVIYPIFDLERHGRDLHLWMRNLEETMIRTCAGFGLSAGRRPPHTGAWIGDRKVAAIGVKVRKWVNLHGIALNCNNDLATFDTIVPCGIQDFGVTSLSQETGRDNSIREAKPIVVRAFADVFGLEAEPA